MMNIRVETEDRWGEFDRAFQTGIDEFVEEIYGSTVRQTTRNMLRGKDAMGRSWRPTKDPDDDTPLVETGEMAASIPRKSRLVDDNRTAIFSAGPEYVEIHEFGAPDANIPKRPFLGPALEFAVSEAGGVLEREFDDRVQKVLL